MPTARTAKAGRAPAAPQVNGIITLTTDFGTADGYVGAMKGVILGRAPSARIVDLTHLVPPQDVRAAAFALQTAVPCFPPGTVHVAVVDPGVGSARRAVLLQAGSQWLVGPDNGLFEGVIRTLGATHAFEIDPAKVGADAVSRTFHGRDLFAPAAALLATGTAPGRIGRPLDGALEPLGLPLAVIREHEVEGFVVHVDRFGNLVTNVPAAAIVPLQPACEVRVGRVLARLVGTYADAHGCELVALEGSGGMIEIAVRNASAAAVLGPGTAARGLPVRVRRTGPPSAATPPARKPRTGGRSR
jgi:S-adenosyl-L-methionine hydrolase (adenosine-forming)